MMRCLTLTLLAALSVLAPAASAQSDKPERYVIKHEHTETGTYIPSNMAVTDYPLDVPYSGLSPKQMARFKAMYQAMPADDEPPYPIAGPKSVMKAIMKAASAVRTLGEIDAVVVVREDGTPDSVSILKSPHDHLTKFVAQALMLERFKPAKCGGKPCAMEYPFSMNIVSGLAAASN